MIRLVAIVSCLVFTAFAAGQDSIVLRQAAKVDAVRAITLADVADLSGPEASRHAGAVVADAGKAKALESGVVRLDISTLRAVLSKADIKWGKVSLSGGTCDITLGAPAQLPALQAPKPTPGVSVKDHVTARLAQHFLVSEGDLKLAFDADRTGLLDLPTAGRTVVATPMGMSDRMPVSIRVYDKGQLISEGAIRVGVQIRRAVVVSRCTITKGMRITDASVMEEDRWLPPSAVPAGVSAVVGAAAKARLEFGAVVLARDVETPAVVRKGDLIAVDSVVGGVVIRLNNARALADGREGEEILVEHAASLAAVDKAQGRRGKPATVLVRVVGPGRATVSEAQ
jgi:flagella basal body P-ring formation protein FlgA